MAVQLPEELAPSLREAAIALLEECGEASPPPSRDVSDMRGLAPEPCYRCGKRSGPKGGHHLPDGTVVKVHRKCHVKLHRGEKSQRIATLTERARFGLKQLGL